MNGLKRVAVLLGIFALLVTFGVSYRGTDVLKRAIVLGLGVDSAENGVLVTAEVVNPGNGSEQVGTFGKIVSASGKTVAEALQAISARCGKEVSLGQCVLLVLGGEFVQTDFTSTLNYFSRSDSFKENAMVCCSEAPAQKIFNRSEALAQSVSVALSGKLKSTAKEVALPACDLLTFARSQSELYKTGFLDVVRFQPSENVETQSGKNQGFFVCDRIAVFRQNRLLCVLNEQETLGFAMLHPQVKGNVFAVSQQDVWMTLRATDKKTDVKLSDGGVDFSVQMNVKLARTDTFGTGGSFASQSDSVPNELLQQAKLQAISQAESFLQKQVEKEFDLLGIHEVFRRKYGGTEFVENLQMRDVTVNLSVAVNEK